MDSKQPQSGNVGVSRGYSPKNDGEGIHCVESLEDDDVVKTSGVHNLLRDGWSEESMSPYPLQTPRSNTRQNAEHIW
jgi:hypothetical protein